MNNYNEKKEIKFIDTEYNELFRIYDGDSVLFSRENGECKEIRCKYIDEYHLYFGNSVYHSCQLAEMLKETGSSITPCHHEKIKTKDRGEER